MVMMALSRNCGLCSVTEEPNKEQKAKCNVKYSPISTMRFAGQECLARVIYQFTGGFQVHTLPMFGDTGVLSNRFLENMHLMMKLTLRI